MSLDQDLLKEECGVLGAYTPGREAARVAFFGLHALQHRGQESAGIAVSDGVQVTWHKEMGLVSQVFDERVLSSLPGIAAIGHTRYSTTGASVLRNAQPIFCQSVVGDIAVAHNGNLINAVELREKLESEGHHFDTSSDTEVIARILVGHIHEGVEAAVRKVMELAKGAYAVTVLTPNRLFGFRDPYGIRPLCAGTIGEDGYLLASESCAFEPFSGHVTKELEPGELVIVDEAGMHFVSLVTAPKHSMCLFEFIYFARPDSVIYENLLYDVRFRMGEKLAEEHPAEADIVVPVPDSGIPAALGFAAASGIQYREGMMKSRYIHRTFIAPDQRMRELGVRMKLSPLVGHIKGQRIVLVDDSIVRGTTTTQIVKMLFDCGAKEVHVRITAPPIKFPCFYGIDMASKGELAAAVMSIEQLNQKLGATSLGFLSIPGAVGTVRGHEGNFCLACFNGQYPIPVPENLKKHAFEDPPKVGEITAVSSSQPSLLSETY